MSRFQVVKGIDLPLILSIMATLAIGVVLIYSATAERGIPYYRDQLVWIGIGLSLMIILLFFDYHLLLLLSPYFYLLGVIALAILLPFGRRISGARSWIAFGPLRFQPSEFMKMVFILLLAYIYSQDEGRYLSLSRLIRGGVVLLVPFVLIALEPDLGTALTYLPIFLGMSFIAGLKPKVVAVIAGVIIISLILGWFFVLKDYQKERIITFLHPEAYPRSSGYQILQARIAVGSGGLLGKGLRAGSQSQLKFVPSQHTDFIFSLLGEEFGFLGVLGVMGLYLVILLRLLSIARLAYDPAGSLIVSGVLFLFLFHFLVNVGMVIGLMPVTGIPLPFLSYGGSSVVSSLAGIGLALNVKIRRFAY
ncbi:MAG: rod shape-determining protein RodA [Acidobacteria bacterium]|nr:rod shape-determining protein RodA [Acidobacteriota bacterium]